MILGGGPAPPRNPLRTGHARSSRFGETTGKALGRCDRIAGIPLVPFEIVDPVRFHTADGIAMPRPYWPTSCFADLRRWCFLFASPGFYLDEPIGVQRIGPARIAPGKTPRKPPRSARILRFDSLDGAQCVRRPVPPNYVRQNKSETSKNRSGKNHATGTVAPEDCPKSMVCTTIGACFANRVFEWSDSPYRWSCQIRRSCDGPQSLFKRRTFVPGFEVEKGSGGDHCQDRDDPHDQRILLQRGHRDQHDC